MTTDSGSNNGSIPLSKSTNPKHIYNLTQSDLDICHQFTIDVLPTNQSHYQSMGGDSFKFYNNIFKSKATEIAVSNLLNSFLNDGYCSFPDFQVYQAPRKSFDPDLRTYEPKTSPIKSFPLHVKSFPLSNDKPFWSWDINPKDPAFHAETAKGEYVALTISDIPNMKIQLIDILPTKRIIPLLKLPRCSRTMKCFYYDDYLSLKSMHINS